MNAGRFKHFVVKRVKDQSRFHALLTLHTGHFVSSLPQTKGKIDEISLLYLSSTNASWFESFVRIQWKIKCGALPEQEKVPEYRILRHFLSFRAPYLELNKIESKWIPVTLPRVPTTTIPNLVLIYQVHLASGKVFLSQKEVFLVLIGIFQGQRP